jgi:hypothetical protein
VVKPAELKALKRLEAIEHGVSTIGVPACVLLTTILRFHRLHTGASRRTIDACAPAVPRAPRAPDAGRTGRELVNLHERPARGVALFFEARGLE